MKTMLLLGGYGFIGTNILKYIDANLNKEWRVVVFDRILQHPAGVSFACVKQSYVGDFADSSSLDVVLNEHSVDLVVHLISTTIPCTSLNAKYDIESNIVPTLGLLDVMIKHNIKDIVFFSSGGAVYGDQPQGHLCRENDELFPKSSYGVSKMAIERYLMQYAALYELRPLILRVSNPYGQYHYSMKQGICNVAMRYALQGDVFTVYGDGAAVKDYIHIDDVCEMLFKLLQSRVHTTILNVASGQLLSVNDILNQIKALIPSFCWQYKTANANDVQYVALSNIKILEMIGDYKFTSFEKGIKSIYQWLMHAETSKI